jgi:hypothetical protein
LAITNITQINQLKKYPKIKNENKLKIFE